MAANDARFNIDIYSSSVSRRRFLSGASATLAIGAVTGCSSTSDTLGLAPAQSVTPAIPRIDPATAYAARLDTEVSLPAFDYTKMDPKYLRQWVKFRSRQKPGTIIVDSSGPYLYLVQGNNQAVRYGIAVGKEGYAWYGDAVMKWKQKWPTWTPPPEMIARSPELKEFEDGMPAGVSNPLGARALYLFKDGRDTLFRVHGTNRPFSIGKAASSGCFRMINQDVIDLYGRVPPGSLVYVKPNIDIERGV
ncbi:MAG: L,D-transpeptidase [Pseudomonadota bacterium]